MECCGIVPINTDTETAADAMNLLKYPESFVDDDDGDDGNDLVGEGGVVDEEVYEDFEEECSFVGIDDILLELLVISL